MKIVCLDAATLGDYDLSIFKNFGEFQSYALTDRKETIERLKDADVVMTNVFFAYEGCGLGFRKGGLVLDNYSKFVGHIIKD